MVNVALLIEKQIFKDMFIFEISWTYYSQVPVFSVYNWYFILNYLSTSQSVCTLTRGQVSLTESIQCEKQKFPQREGNCLKVSWHHFASAPALGAESKGLQVLCALLHHFDKQKAWRAVRKSNDGIITDHLSVWWDYSEKTNEIAMAKRPLLFR